MSAGADMLKTGYGTLVEHHRTTVRYTAKGSAPVDLDVLVSNPAEVVSFGRPVNGVAWYLFAPVGEVDYTVDDLVQMDCSSYRVLQVEHQAAGISTRLAIGKSTLAGRQ